jgi:hypothetical protein
VTHEHTQGDEPEGGPSHDHRLPDADSIPVAPGPFDLTPEHWPGEWDDDCDPVCYVGESAPESARADAIDHVARGT